MWLWRKFHRLMEFFDIYEIEPSFSISENELKKKYLVLKKNFIPIVLPIQALKSKRLL